MCESEKFGERIEANRVNQIEWIELRFAAKQANWSSIRSANLWFAQRIGWIMNRIESTSWFAHDSWGRILVNQKNRIAHSPIVIRIVVSFLSSWRYRRLPCLRGPGFEAMTVPLNFLGNLNAFQIVFIFKLASSSLEMSLDYWMAIR